MVAGAPSTSIYVGNGVSNGWKEICVTNVQILRMHVTDLMYATV